MLTSTGGDSSAPSGGLLNQQSTGHTPPPPPSNSSTTAAGPTPSRLFSLFEECVEHGIWASLETFTRRGEVCVDFSCRLRARALPRRAANNRNVERTRQWKEAKQQRRRHSPPNPAPFTAAPPAQDAVNVPAHATSTPAATRTFAEVAANPVHEKESTAASQTVNAATKAAAGFKGRASTAGHPKRVAKTALAASRVSKRSAILSKKRAATAAAKNVPASPADDDETAPELLRGKEGETKLDSTLEISLAVSSPPQLPPSSPPSSLSPLPPSPSLSPPSTYHNPCDCPTPCSEEDFHDETWEEGVRLNTFKPPWENVFPHVPSLRRCRFCKEPLPNGGGGKDNGDDDRDSDSNEECQDCKDLSVFCLVKKYAPRWRYPNK